MKKTISIGFVIAGLLMLFFFFFSPGPSKQNEVESDKKVILEKRISEKEEIKTTDEVQDTSLKDPKDLRIKEVEINIKDLLRSSNREETEGEFSKGYKKAVELSFSDLEEEVRLNFFPNLENALAVIFVGGEGQTFIDQVKVFETSTSSNSVGEFDKSLFKDDWKKIDITTLVSSLSFKAKAKNKSQLKVYIQFLGDEE